MSAIVAGTFYGHPARAMDVAALKQLTVQITKNTAVKVCVPPKMDGIDSSSDQALPDAVLKSCTGYALASDNEEQLETQPRVRDGNVILIYIDDSSITFGDAGASEVSITIHNVALKNENACHVTEDLPLAKRHFLWCKIAADKYTTKTNSPSHDDPIAVVVKEATNISRFPVFVKTWSLTSPASQGFWVPVGLFGTNFKSEQRWNRASCAAHRCGVGISTESYRNRLHWFVSFRELVDYT